MEQPTEEEIKVAEMFAGELADDDPVLDPAARRISEYVPDDVTEPPYGWPAETERS